MGKGKTEGAECACGCLVVITIIGLAGLGIAKIVMGAKHLHDCSIEQLIPIWLIVSGCAPILFGAVGRKSNEKSGDNKNICGTVCGVIGFLFYFTWLIFGSIWVYPNCGKVTADDFTPCTGNITTNCIEGNCDKSLITFAFAMVTIDWIFMGLWIVLICYVILRTS